MCRRGQPRISLAMGRAMVRGRKSRKAKRNPARRKQIAATQSKVVREGPRAHRDTAARRSLRSTRNAFIGPKLVVLAGRRWTRGANSMKSRCSTPTRRAARRVRSRASCSTTGIRSGSYSTTRSCAPDQQRRRTRPARHWVIARRISHGTRTAEGTHAFCLLASVIETCRQHAVSPWPYLAEVVRQRRKDLPRLLRCQSPLSASLLPYADGSHVMGG
jgi:hypothetical protein